MFVTTPPNFGNWLSDIASAVVPKKTIVGKLLAGNTKGAVAAIVGGPPATAQPVLVPAPGVFSPGGWVDRNSTLLLGGVAALVAVLVLKRRSARR